MGPGLKTSIFLICAYGIIALAYSCKFTAQSVKQTDVKSKWFK